MALCSPVPGGASCSSLGSWRGESPPVRQRTASMSVENTSAPAPWHSCSRGEGLRRDSSQGAGEGSPSAPPAPWGQFSPWVLTGLFRQLVLLIYFIIHTRLTEGERVLFYSERGDVAINAVTATPTWGGVSSPAGCPDCRIVPPLRRYLGSNCACGVFSQRLAVVCTYGGQERSTSPGKPR